MYDYNNDYIRFNAGRWYGKVRFPYLVTNWKQFYRDQNSQRVPGFTKGNVTLDLAMYLKQPNPYKYINNTNVKYSQANKDQTVYDLFVKKNGFFIEMGTFDGMWLERHHDWT
jgi:hypothetical protein